MIELSISSTLHQKKFENVNSRNTKTRLFEEHLRFPFRDTRNIWNFLRVCIFALGLKQHGIKIEGEKILFHLKLWFIQNTEQISQDGLFAYDAKSSRITDH